MLTGALTKLLTRPSNKHEVQISGTYCRHWCVARLAGSFYETAPSLSAPYHLPGVSEISATPAFAKITYLLSYRYGIVS